MINLVIDTDIGNDSDDAGALAIAHQLANIGECRILAITSSTSRIDGAQCADAINHYYKRSDIMIGMTKRKSFLDEKDGYGQYSRAVIKQYPYTLKEVPTSTLVLRKTLIESPTKVVFVCLGPLNNIKDLMLSKADEISTMNGEELIDLKVERFVIMGGDFSKDDVVFMLGNQKMMAEWNILQDIDAAQYVIHHIKRPILFVPYAVGLIKTGHAMFSKPNYESPIKLSYEIHNNGPRQSWDPIAVYVAIKDPNSLFVVSDLGIVTVLDNGKTIFNKTEKGNQRYLLDHLDAIKTILCLDEYII